MLTTQDALFSGGIQLLQPQTGHRAGTDAVLLAMATPEDARAIVDLGAASGVVGLQAARLNPHARVTLIERAPELVALARRNITLNGLEAQVEAHEADVLSLGRNAALCETFDCVLTNPPFHQHGRVRKTPDRLRAEAHVMSKAPDETDALDLWLRNAASILKPKGRIILIHQAQALPKLLVAMMPRFGALSLRFVQPRAEEPAIRLLVCGIKGSRAPLRILPPLILMATGADFTPEAAALHAGRRRLSSS